MGARSKRPKFSSVSHTMGRGAFGYLCLALELAAADLAAADLAVKDTAVCAVLNAIGSQLEYKLKRTYSCSRIYDK